MADQLMHSTVRIECVDPKGQRSSGTGFIFDFLKTKENKIPAVVTNRHVLEGASKAYFHLTIADANGDPDYGKHERFAVDNFEGKWIGHPNKDIDLAIFGVGDVLKKMLDAGKPVFYRSMAPSLFPNADDLASMTAMEEIVMVGYPTGIWDSKNNLPVMRRGITATPFYLDYEGRKEFMIDAACFPGSSGSPVMIFNQGSYSDRSGNLTIGSRLLLLGILYAGPQYTAEGKIIVVEIPTKAESKVTSAIPTNLGMCIKAEQLLPFEDILKATREKAAAQKTKSEDAK